ncbi:MAG: Gfo/Idh/MocA family oxidoreductase [Abditibacteriota bacterium]|nr:Gfo/Idh/MocA family oxidoreductase [Abditibacteriota bacterium]
MSKKVKIGVFGAGRGSTMVGVMSQHPDAELVAICDKFKPALESCRQLAEKHGEKVTLYEDFDKFLEHDMDAVVLANYATEHAPYAVRCLRSGRHVTSEVLACETMAEAVELVEAVEETGKVYTYSENYCYFRSTAEMKKIYRRGDIGEFQHGEGEYVHDGESIRHLITYGQRDHWRNWIPATFYCTHAAGPIITITGLRPVKVVAFDTPNKFARYTGKRAGEGAMLCVQFENGATGKFLQGGYRRSMESIWYCVYGTNGQMESDRFGARENMLHTWIQDAGKADYYEPKPDKENELSRATEGHGGSDYWTMQHFLDCILDREGREEAIDVYTGLDMTMIGTLGYRSAWEGNRPVEIPDLRDKSQRDKYRDDHFCCDPKYAGPGQPESCSFGRIEIPDVVYDMVRIKYETETKNKRD